MEKLKALGLDEKQKEAVKAIHFRTKKEMVRNRADVQVAEIELKEILSKDPVDLNAAEAAVKKIEGVKSEMRMLHIKAMEEIKANLTPGTEEEIYFDDGHGQDGTWKGHEGEMQYAWHGQHGRDGADGPWPA